MPRAFGRGDGPFGEAFPEAPPFAKCQRQRLHAWTPLPRRLRPARKASGNQRFQLGPDGLAEHRRRAVGRNADDQRRAVDDRAEGEIAKCELVDHVDRDAGHARCARKTRGLLVCFEGSHCDRGAGEIARLPAAQMNEDRALRWVGGNGKHLIGGFTLEHVDVRAGGRE